MKNGLAPFVLAFVLSASLIWIFAVFPAYSFDPNNLIHHSMFSLEGEPHSTAQNVDMALIILATENGPSMKESMRYIEEKGGRIFHIYPTHVLIGNVPKATSEELVGRKGIEAIYYSNVDSGIVKKYGDIAVFAVDAWNNNFMGQADIRGLTPNPEASEPAPIKADMKIRPQLNKSKDLQIESAPYGAGFYDTSEYMIGKISVAIILPESNGAIDPNQENWASSDISNVVSEIQAGLNWWAAREWKAHLQFTYTVHITATSYEPISRPSSDQGLWITEAMQNIGYTNGDYFYRVRSFLNDLRYADGTDWAVAISVANSYWDLDGKFADGTYFAYAYYGGPFMLMTYDNDGYGIANMDAVTAHEMGHIFYAADEYYEPGYNDPGYPTDRWGYLAVENQNLQGPGRSGSSNVPCIMRGGVSPYTQGAVCLYTRGQIGWRDTDSDGILDIIDFEPDTILTPYSPDPTQDNTPTYAGTAFATATYPNMNPHGPRNNITINTITRVQYWDYGMGEWIDATASDGAFDEVIEDFTFTSSPLLTGAYTFLSGALNSAGNWETSYAMDALTIDILPPNVPSISEDHCGSDWTTHNSPYFIWSDPGDSGTGVSYYEGSLDDGTPFTVSSPYHPTWSDGIHTFKVRAVDGVGLQSGWSNVITVKIDTTPPPGSISINAGSAYTTSTSVTLTLSTVDGDGSGIVYMCFSNDGASWTSWEYYSKSKSWTLTSEDGTKTVYVKYKDYVGLESSAAYDTIILDSVAPVTTINHELGSPTVSLSAFDATSGVEATYYRINDGSWTLYTGPFTLTWTGSHTVDCYSVDGAGNTETPPKSLSVHSLTVAMSPPVGGSTSPAPGTYWYDSGMSVMVSETPASGYIFNHWDLDGSNVGESPSYTVIIDTPHTLTAVFKSLIPTSVTVKLSEDIVELGKGVRISGTLTADEYPEKMSGTLVLEASKEGLDWQVIKEFAVKSTRQYRFSHSWTPEEAGDYTIRARYGGDETYSASESDLVPLTVERTGTTLRLSASPRSAYWGREKKITVTLTSRYRTPMAGQIVVYANGTTIRVIDVSGAMGRLTASFTWAPELCGKWILTAQYSGDDNYQPSTARAVSLEVKKIKTSLTLKFNATRIELGQAVNMTITLEAMPSPTDITGQLLIEYRVGGGDWILLDTITIEPGLTVKTSYVWKPEEIGKYTIRVAYSGDEHYETPTKTKRLTVR